MPGWAIIEAPMENFRAAIHHGTPEKPAFSLLPIAATPHYKALQSGNASIYAEYLEKHGAHVGGGKEHSLRAFIELGRNFHYLSRLYARDYILVTPLKNEGSGVLFRVLDGVHRLALLAFAGETHVPVVVCGATGISEMRLKWFVESFKNHFPEWYTPVAFDAHTVIHERTYPKFIERPEFLVNGERGMAKWEQSIAPYLPDVAGRRVWDIGCNVGLFSLQMSRLGAEMVIGIDRGETIIQPSNPSLPSQSVVQQAWFVKRAFELRDGRIYDNVEFKEEDIALFDFTRIDADMVFSTCVLYHFGPRFAEIMASFPPQVRCVFLQTNLGHKGLLGKWAAPDTHERILRRAGFTRVRRHEPAGLKYPVIVGER